MCKTEETGSVGGAVQMSHCDTGGEDAQSAEAETDEDPQRRLDLFFVFAGGGSADVMDQ